MRARITAVATVLLAVVLTAVAVVIVTIQRRELVANLDNVLEQRTDDLAADVAAAGHDPVRLANTNDEDRLAQLVSLDGVVLAATPNLDGLAALHGEDLVDHQIIRTVDDLPVEDDSFRLLSRPVETPDGPAILHVAENIDDLRDSIRILTTSLLVAVPATVAVLGLLVWWLVGRTLRPVEAIRAEVADIGGSELHRRVPVPATGDEIARLASTMNDMLDRLEASTIRQRRFVADASHELRSPLTRIRTEVEVALARPDDLDGEATLRSVSAESEALQRLIEDLLQLARVDDGTALARREPVDLDDVVIREARRARAAGHRVELDGVSGAQVLGDSDQLTRVVRNLLDNAVRHAEHRVRLSLAEIDGVATLTVSDDGLGVPDDQRDRVFERFARLDDARTRHDGGTGLGLAIVREVVIRHDGSVTVDDAPGGGARFTVRIPAAP
ncbi:MAG: HAMP domain-containing histidine kinase [Acidimicrobiales bacterium]|nr:HAMP domain-containing histidine kinase [Acidimicrobiales bacterium]